MLQITCAPTTCAAGGGGACTTPSQQKEKPFCGHGRVCECALPAARADDAMGTSIHAHRHGANRTKQLINMTAISKYPIPPPRKGERRTMSGVDACGHSHRN